MRSPLALFVLASAALAGCSSSEDAATLRLVQATATTPDSGETADLHVELRFSSPAPERVDASAFTVLDANGLALDARNHTAHAVERGVVQWARPIRLPFDAGANDEFAILLDAHAPKEALPPFVVTYASPALSLRTEAFTPSALR